jgi:Beta-galactosidase/beta-glucuronidase
MEKADKVNHISLDGEWELWHWPEGELGVTTPDDLSTMKINPIVGHVPGNVELDLERAGLIQDPFYAGNIRSLREFERHEWWYRREFHVAKLDSGQRWHLVFAGLDTLATVWLNGNELGTADNMLIEHRFEASAVLRPDQLNCLVVRLGSVTNAARRYRYDALFTSSDYREESLFIRKAPHMWGWDIMPRAVSAGIWRSVWLELQPETSIEQLYYWTSAISPDEISLGVHYQIQTASRGLDDFVLRFSGECNGHTFEYEWPVEFLAGGCSIPIPGGRLWWPKGYGDPALYTVRAQLLQHGRVVAERTERIGLRKVVLKRTEKGTTKNWVQNTQTGIRQWSVPPDPESHFLFIVNDEPIMIKGANWVPLDAFHSRDQTRVDQVVALFDDLGCNMIRCWGGNVYEDQHFYDLCDEKGILVWQDFALACCRYPQTDEFLNRVGKEVESVTIKLRNHPSLVLWCGDNEVDTKYVDEGLSPENNRLTREVIPQMVHRHDPFRPYLPSSPYLPSRIVVEDSPQEIAPEQHLWGPRGYFKSAYYVEHTASFISEIGYHGCPNVSSVRRFISPKQVWPWANHEEWHVHSGYHWQHRAIDRDRVKLMSNQIKELFGHVPDDLESFALASQIAQAEALKFFIESTRLRKWRTSGILWWNVIDGWPQFSDAVVDYYFGRKLAYHYIRRCQKPVCLIIGEPGAGKYLPIVACNDTRQEAEIRYQIWDAEGGQILIAGTFVVPPNQNWQVDRLRTYASQQQLYLLRWEMGSLIFGNHYLVGHAPVSLDRYRGWLPTIAALTEPFSASNVAI